MSIAVEKRTISAMVSIYCNDLHQNPEGLCNECSALQSYALKRIEYCPFKTSKPACNTCTVHCYALEKRERVKQVMRHSGRKMPLRHPYLSIIHLINTFKKGVRK
jgi:hypothetical protein